MSVVREENVGGLLDVALGGGDGLTTNAEMDVVCACGVVDAGARTDAVLSRVSR